MSSVVKNLLFGGLLALNTAYAKDLNILVLTDDPQLSCFEKRGIQAAQTSVTQAGAYGHVLVAVGAEPSAACTGDTMWSRLGRHMVQAYKVDNVRFFALGGSGLKITDLLDGGSLHAALSALFREANRQHLRFDYSLLQHGGQDTDKAYLHKLTKLMRTASANAEIAKWIVARNSGCDAVLKPSVLDAQWRAGSNPLFSRFPGPNLDAIGVQYRTDACHFNAAGKEKLAGLWVDAIKEADKADNVYQKETLLYFFKQ